MIVNVWVLTREINMLDQDGELFVAVFGHRPSHAELVAEGVPSAITSWVLQKGGRIGVEYEWFHLRVHQLEVS